MIETADRPESLQEESFIESALKAARHSQVRGRRKILMDIADLLSCDADELGFLFVNPVLAANDDDPVILPDYRATLRSETLARAQS